MKTCKVCLAEKPESEFYPCKTSADRLRYECKSCCKTAAIMRAKQHPERRRAINRRHLARHKDRYLAAWRAEYQRRREYHRVRRRARYERHREDEIASAKKYARENAGQIREDRRERYRLDPEYRARCLFYAHERRLRLAAGDLTMAQWIGRWNELDGRCAYCGAPATDMDHVIPLRMGGEHALDNVVPACDHCNSTKQGRPVSAWRKFVPLAA